MTINPLQWLFADYSPDGELEIDGQLVLGLLSQPVALQGDLNLTGSQEGLATIDMTIAIVSDSVNVGDVDLDFGSVVTCNGTPFEVDDIWEKSAPIDSTSAP